MNTAAAPSAQPHSAANLTSGEVAIPFGRVAAASVIAEFLRVHSADPQLTFLGRLFGLSPLTTNSRSWYLGALGEIEVARRLETLGHEWCVLHSVPVGTRGSDIDHVAIGPPGVVTINTKFHEGAKVWVGSRRILVNGQKTEHLRNSRYEAKRVARILSERVGHDVAAYAALVIVGASTLTIRQQPDGVAVLRDTQLNRWMTSQTASLDVDRWNTIRMAAESSETWGLASYEQPDLAHFQKVCQSVHAAKRRRIVWVLGALLAPFFATPALFLLLW